MNTRELIDKAIDRCYENPNVPNRQDMISTGQSITPLIYNLTYLMTPKRVFEWGPGQTTYAFLLGDPLVEVVSYENEEEWYEEYRKQLREKDKKAYDRVMFVGVFGMIEHYEKPDFPDNTFDIILVDGVHRTTCFEAAERMVKPGGVVLVHDAQSKVLWRERKTDMEFYGYYQDRIQPIELTAIYIKKEI